MQNDNSHITLTVNSNANFNNNLQNEYVVGDINKIEEKINVQENNIDNTNNINNIINTNNIDNTN